VVTADEEVSHADPSRFAHVWVGVVRGEAELDVHVVKVQSLTQLLAIKQLRVGAT
jgi:hypothetical protein